MQCWQSDGSWRLCVKNSRHSRTSSLNKKQEWEHLRFLLDRGVWRLPCVERRSRRPKHHLSVVLSNRPCNHEGTCTWQALPMALIAANCSQQCPHNLLFATNAWLVADIIYCVGDSRVVIVNDDVRPPHQRLLAQPPPPSWNNQTTGIGHARSEGRQRRPNNDECSPCRTWGFRCACGRIEPAIVWEPTDEQGPHEVPQQSCLAPPNDHDLVTTFAETVEMDT